MVDIVSVGITKIDFMPRENFESISDVKSFEIIPSGSAVNFALVSARLGLNVGLLSCVSSDEFGEYVYSYLKDNKIDVSHLKKVKETQLTTSIYAINKKITEDVSYTQENAPEKSFVFDDALKDYLKNKKLIYTTESFLRQKKTRDEVFKLLKYANEQNITVAYDPGIKEELWSDSPDAIIEAHEKIIEYVDIYFSDTQEIKWIANSVSLGDSVKFVYELGPEIIVLRHGTRGVLIFDGRELIKVPLHKIPTSNVLNGDDIFNAAFLYLHLREYDLHTCGLFAQHILSAKKTQSWHIDIDENNVVGFMREHKRE